MEPKQTFVSVGQPSPWEAFLGKVYPGPVIALLLVVIAVLATMLVMQKPEAETTFRAKYRPGQVASGALEINPVLRENGAWVLKKPQHCSLEFTPDEDSGGMKGSVVSTTGLATKGRFEVTGESRIKFDFDKMPIFWKGRGHDALDFKFFVTAEDQLILIASTQEDGDLLQGQVYVFQWEAQSARP